MKTRILFLFIFMALGLAACATSQGNLPVVFDENPTPVQAVTSPDPNEARHVPAETYSMHSSPTYGVFSSMEAVLKINPDSTSAQRIMNESSGEGSICFYCQQHQL